VVHELALAISKGMKLSALAAPIHVYPTLASTVGNLAVESAYTGARRLAWVVGAGRAWDRLPRR
jgi:hypothetical protein